MPRTTTARQRILEALAKGPLPTVKQVGKATGLTRQAVTPHLQALIESGEVIKGYTLSRHPPVQCYLLVGKPKSGKNRQSIRTVLEGSPEIIPSFTLITGAYVFIALVTAAPNSTEFATLAAALDAVAEDTTTLVCVPTHKTS